MEEVAQVLTAPRLLDSEVSSIITPLVLEVLAEAPQSAAAEIFLQFGWDLGTSQFSRPLEREPMAACILALVSPAERETAEETMPEVDSLRPHCVPVPGANELKASEDYLYCSQCTQGDCVVNCEDCAAARRSDPATWSQEDFCEELTKYHIPVPAQCTHDTVRQLAQNHMLPDRVLARLLEYVDHMQPSVQFADK